MPRPTTIDRLPTEIRDAIGKLRQQGRTIDEIRAKLAELDVDVSRSALGRHVKDLDRMGEILQHSRAASEALINKLGDAPENRAARLNIEMMHAITTRAFLTEEGEPVEYSAEERMFIARTLKDLASAAKMDAELVAKLRREAATEAAKALERGADKAQKSGRHIDPETLRLIREEIYGISRPAASA